jgi:hypothetical protein
LQVIETAPYPGKLVIEEWRLADWLYRNLSPHVDEMIVCDPHRNALISKDGDKSDPLKSPPARCPPRQGLRGRIRGI